MNKKKVLIGLWIVVVMGIIMGLLGVAVATKNIVKNQQCSTLTVTRYGQLVITIKGNFPNHVCKVLSDKFKERPETFVYTVILNKNPNLKPYCQRQLENNRVAIVSSNDETTGIAFCESFMTDGSAPATPIPSQNTRE